MKVGGEKIIEIEFKVSLIKIVNRSDNNNFKNKYKILIHKPILFYYIIQEIEILSKATSFSLSVHLCLDIIIVK